MNLYRLTSTSAVIGALIALATSTAMAFNDPVDRQGPLTVRIEGPETITELNQATEYRVTMENRGDAVIAGKLQLSGVDRWKCEPADGVSFEVAAGGKQSISFQVTAGEGTYAALYPLHARATFTWQGQELTAHPILILEAKTPPPSPKLAPSAWQPFVVTADRTLSLWQLASQRTVIAPFQGEAIVMPVGWRGSADNNRTSVDIRNESLAGGAKRALAIHPPWAGGQSGTAWVEYPLQLPASEPITLDFATAVTPTGTGDGVTFRVRVAALDAPADQAGEVVWERHSAAKDWEAGQADLSRFAGRTVRVQLESHPGPAQNTSFDQSYWAEPTLHAGTSAADRPFPPETLEPSTKLGTVEQASGRYDVHVAPGRRGLLDADVGFVSGSTSLFFRGFQVQALGVRLDDPGSPVTLTAVTREATDGGCRFRHAFRRGADTFDLIGTARIENESLKVQFRLENAPEATPWQAPRIETVSAGAFSQSVNRVYAGHGNVIERPQAFRLSFDGHRLATSHVGLEFENGLALVQAVDLPPDELAVDPAEQRYSLQAAGETTFRFIPARTVWEAARHYRETNGLHAAGGVEKLAGRFVFDLWGGQYGSSGEQLEMAFRYGLTDAAVVWHNWQRWGYDYRLPEIYPPNPNLGTEDELRAMLNACREAGVLFALHDNYIDIYPDAEGFSYEQNVAFNERGEPVKAWFNQGREAQSYRYRSDQIAPFLQGNLRSIKQHIPPTAYFIDVWSSIKPYDYWTADGQFFDRRYTRDSWGEHFAWIRDLLGDDAPQISESGHDQLIGWLDGAQTNHLRVGKPTEGYYSWSVWNIDCDDAERTPWFDFVHHDRFILHGAGYSGRYQAGWDERMHGIYSDDYLATEMLTGHPVMVSRPFDRDVVRKYWLTQDVMRALAMRTIEAVEFVDDDLHRQHVRWSGGGQVWVNRGPTDWEVDGYRLPEFGFLAKVPTDRGLVTAAICRRGDQIVELSASPDQLYVNGRKIAGGPLRIRPSVQSATSDDPRRLDFVIDWEMEEPIPADYRPFIHFVDAQGEIIFQASYDAAKIATGTTGQVQLPATAWIPAGAKAGETFELRVGMYPPGKPLPRLRLLGPDDDEQRIRLGSIVIRGDGDQATGVDWKPLAPQPDPYLARQNPESIPVDFGGVITASACRLTRDGDALILTPLPGERTAGSTWELRWDRLPWRLPKPSRIEALNAAGEVFAEQEIGERIVVPYHPSVFAYRVR